MAKKLVFLLFVIILIPFQVTAFAAEDIMEITKEAGYTDVLEINKPKTSIVVDGTNGQILWGDNVDVVREPASISKMMTVFLVFDAIKEGKFTLDTNIQATENDQAISELYAISNSKIVAGVEYPVRELLKMVVVPSSNVATVMLANVVSDNQAGEFIKQMNEKAHQIGMKNTQFYNCSGASAITFEGLYTPEGYDPYGSNTSTARDLATMVFHLINDHPEVLEFTSQPKVTTMAGTPYEETFETYNYSLPGAKYGFEGVDGLKTGSGPSSAFNYVATAKRENTRLIEVIMGVGDWSDQDGEYYRHPFGNALLKKTFDEYEQRLILPKGEHEIEGKSIKLENDFYGVVKKNEEPQLTIQDKQIVLTNQKELLTDNMPKLAANYIEGSKTDEKKADNGDQSAENKEKTRALPTKLSSILDKVITYGIPAALLILGLVFLFFPSKRKAIGRRSRKSPRKGVIVLRIIGALSILASIYLVIKEFI
ncbi:D-alanyl-D-alanine carboxypeptidase [Enterococcus sp. JM4C]|uniref:DUF1958 domain-containing protein n=1 Tax=Candidatus Enterococcus huntleyi TaxID=1857217 RepID=UPI001379C90E|nr:DUF1958 domain-containing protein [Enterococcus sp. JM4C]KAF1297540.1 D-alanyl-D-alanine carboxypeptidase [Enterococcus sp. JM4C]